MNTPPTCFVCATPIGHLADVSSRLISTLENVHTIFSEDTRVTRVLLDHYSISTPLVSLQQFNEKSRVALALELLGQGHDIAIVSDAGTPCISDPGAVLIQELVRCQYVVSPIPGPSAVTSLLSVAGLPLQSFYFGGFFPRSDSEQAQCLAHLSQINSPGVFFESPNRLITTIGYIGRLYPEASLVLGKEITKHFETFFSGSPMSLLDQLGTGVLKGEWCFLIHLPPITRTDLETVLQALLAEGLSKSQIKSVATRVLHYSRNDVYRAVESIL